GAGGGAAGAGARGGAGGPAGPAAVNEGHVCIRAEDVRLEKGADPGGAANVLPGVVRELVPEGPVVRVRLDCGFPLTAVVSPRACRDLGLREGGRVTALVEAAAGRLVAAGEGPAA